MRQRGRGSSKKKASCCRLAPSAIQWLTITGAATHHGAVLLLPRKVGLLVAGHAGGQAASGTAVGAQAAKPETM